MAAATRGPAGGPEVWVVDLDPPRATLARLGRVLHPEERAAVTTGTPAVRRRRLVARAALVDLVAARTGRAAPTIRTGPSGPHGKPEILGGGPAYSVSHSGDLGLVALAPSGAIGVDVERVRARVHLDALAARVLDAHERERWRGAPEAERLERFLRAWVRKEAHRKAEGLGLRAPLGALGAEPPAGWRWYDLAPAPGYVGALALARPAPGPGAPVVRRWRPDREGGATP